MSNNITLYVRLLKDTYEGLKMLYDISKDVGCPYLSSLGSALNSLDIFRLRALRDINEYDSDSSSIGTN